jgi:hypothetical protein
MPSAPIQVPQATQRPGGIQRKPRLVIAGATGVLGNEVLRRLVGLNWFESTQVLAREPITQGLRGLSTAVVTSDSPARWLPSAANTGVILFDPPRLFYGRERALWTPRPDQLPEVARWMRRSSVDTLAIASGCCSSARPKNPARPIFRFMVPGSEQPVRSANVAELVAVALRLAPPGIHIAAPELVWRARRATFTRLRGNGCTPESGAESLHDRTVSCARPHSRQPT